MIDPLSFWLGSTFAFGVFIVSLVIVILYVRHQDTKDQ